MAYSHPVMKPVAINLDAVTAIAAAHGINSVSELWRRCGAEAAVGDRSYFGRVMSGHRPCPPTVVLALAVALDRSPSDLLADPEDALAKELDAAVTDKAVSP